MTLRLHYAPDNASLCVRIALEHLELPYETRLVDRKARAQKSPAYLALNPMGLIPVLETPDGAICETAAILLWLAEREGRMIAPAGSTARGGDLQWLFWLSNTLHAGLRTVFYPDQYVPEPHAEALRAHARDRCRQHCDILEDATGLDWLTGETPTVHGCYLAPLLRWGALYGGVPDILERPRLARFAQAAEDWSALIRAAEAEGLGPHPITAPQPAKPPEGSAT